MTDLSPKPTGHNHPFQQRRWSVCRLSEFLEHDVCDVVGGVEPNKIKEGERTHGIGTPKRHSLVDVLQATEPALVRTYGIQQIRHHQAVHDKSWPVRRG